MLFRQTINKLDVNENINNFKILRSSVQMSSVLIGGFNSDNLDQILAYVKTKIKNVVEPTHTTKYAIILYGPPASGKSKAFDLAIENINSTNLITPPLTRNHFLELNIDDIVEQTFDWTLNKNTDINHNKALYYTTRKKVDKILEILLQTCLLMNTNFTFETTGRSFDWTLQIIKEINSHNYKVILMYPFTVNKHLLVDRALNRGNASGRYVTMDDFNTYKYIETASDSFNNSIIPNLSQFYIVIKYDAEIPIAQSTLNFQNIYFMHKPLPI